MVGFFFLGFSGGGWLSGFVVDMGHDGWLGFFGLFFSFLFLSFLWIVAHRVERGKSDIENLLDLFLLLALHCIHVPSLIFFFSYV